MLAVRALARSAKACLKRLRIDNRFGLPNVGICAPNPIYEAEAPHYLSQRVGIMKSTMVAVLDLSAALSSPVIRGFAVRRRVGCAARAFPRPRGDVRDGKPGAIIDHCSTCHDAPNVGDHSPAVSLDNGTSHSTMPGGKRPAGRCGARRAHHA